MYVICHQPQILFPGHIYPHVIVFEGNSQAKTMIVEKFGKDLTPHRVKYRTLKR